MLYGSHIKLTKWFLALSLDGRGHPLYLKMQVTDNLKQDSVKRFVGSTCVSDSTIRSDGYSSYIPALTDFTHEYSSYNSDSGLLRWLHIILGNAKVFVLGTYHGLPKTCLQSYLDEFCFRFFRRFFGADLFLHLVLAISLSSQADSKG